MFRDLKKVLIEKCDDFIALRKDADRCIKEQKLNQKERATLLDEKKSYRIKLVHNKRIKEIDDRIKELDRKSKEIEDEIKEINQKLGYYQTIRIYSISDAEDYKSKVEQAKSLRDLDLDFKKAKEILSKSNIEVVLDESDKMPNNVMAMSGIGGKEGYAIAFTHLTDYLPENGEILRMIDKGARHKISGEWGEVEIDPARGTTHLAACSEVANVYGSSWDNKKIGIILPLNGLEKDMNITSYSPADFQIRSKVRIPNNGYIICPKDMVDEANQKNPNLNIIGYEGENVRGLVNQMLVYLGYDYSRVGENRFKSEMQTSIYKEKIEEYFGIKEPVFVLHVNTKERQDERVGYFFKKLDAFIKGIESKTVNYNDDYKQEIISIIMQGIDTDKIAELILEQLGVISENQTIKEIVENILDKTRDSIRENTTINDLVKDSLGDNITTTELNNIDRINEVNRDGTSPEVQESK